MEENRDQRPNWTTQTGPRTKIFGMDPDISVVSLFGEIIEPREPERVPSTDYVKTKKNEMRERMVEDKSLPILEC